MLTSFYRFFQTKLVEKYFLRYFFSQQRMIEAHLHWREIQSFPSLAPLLTDLPHPAHLQEPKEPKEPKEPRKRIWFHAASVGELESISPLIEELASSEKYELILTILSESARNTLEKLKTSLLQKKSHLLFVGYSPWEGHWSEALDRLRPHLLMTAKYEAWPDLWISLQERDIPLVIVSAQDRSSLRMARRICRWARGALPRLVLLTCTEEDISPLRFLFPQARIECVGEPRWDRVYFRSQQSRSTANSRARELIQLFSQYPRPWGVIGSAWIEDLRNIIPALIASLSQKPATLWIVPHRVDHESVHAIDNYLQNQGFRTVKTSELKSSQDIPQSSPPLSPSLSPSSSSSSSSSSSAFSLPLPSSLPSPPSPLSPLSSPSLSSPSSSELAPTCILVNEMGFLSELYSLADWAFVGGGFNAGVHSTIEPAIYGIPIAIGPVGSEKFSEVQILKSHGQLQILQRPEEAQSWALNLKKLSSEQQNQWKAEIQRHLGATQKIRAALENFI